jgi:hypothetical protein
VVVNGEVVAPSAYRLSAFVDLEDTVAWWAAASALGALLAAAGVLEALGLGEVIAITGVALLFGAGVFAGAERTEAATAAGAGGVVSTSVGISAVMGTDRSPLGSLLALGIVGGALLIVGALGAVRAHRRRAKLIHDA